ncbi:hypothetical protein FCM35_KLT06663 [Carex littledalei]|uniref:Uncharacterized protein n=1 Tax=Carex littledalei TaxID=544730 RepID=A0A833QVT8_9POAL|nr:hypothetical protein FCM35_KLT06663 [Carex littledalei]
MPKIKERSIKIETLCDFVKVEMKVEKDGELKDQNKQEYDITGTRQGNDPIQESRDQEQREETKDRKSISFDCVLDYLARNLCLSKNHTGLNAPNINIFVIRSQMYQEMHMQLIARILEKRQGNSNLEFLKGASFGSELCTKSAHCIKIQKLDCPYATLKTFEIIRERYSNNGVPIAPTGLFIWKVRCGQLYGGKNQTLQMVVAAALAMSNAAQNGHSQLNRVGIQDVDTLQQQLVLTAYQCWVNDPFAVPSNGGAAYNQFKDGIGTLLKLAKK